MKASNLYVRTLAATACVLGCMAAISVRPAQADQYDKRTILTINEPVQVRETLLEPGQYVFKLLDSQSDRHIVQIYNGDQTHLINTFLAVPDYRIQPSGSSRFLFWETPPGTAKALRAWFYPGDNYGQEFPYPKHLITVNTVAARVETPAPAPPPEPAPQPEAQAQVQEQQQEQVEIAQNTPPPPPPAVAEEQQPQPAPPAPPQTLPKTGSNYPLFGLAGLLSLGFYGLLRVKRSA